MQYKRTLMSCLIVILILCTSMLGIGATEEATPFEVAVEVNSSTAISTEPFVLQAGDSLTVSIAINGNPTFGAFELWLKYDPEVLTLVKTEDGKISYTAGDVVAADELIVMCPTDNSVKVVNKTWSEDIKNNGTIITLNFKVNETAHASSALELDKTIFMTSNIKIVKVDTVTDADVHVHKFTSEPTVEAATCSAFSKTTYTCDTCKEAVVIEGTEYGAHSFGEWKTVTEATCDTIGSEERVCTICETEKETRDVDSLGHDFSENRVQDLAPTCTTEGSESKVCSRCGLKTDTTAISALGHQFGEWTKVKDPTCEETGSKKRTCTREGCNEAETLEIDALGHQSVPHKEEPATKDAPGYTGGTYCSVCEKTLTPRDEIPQIKDYTWIYILVAVVVVVAIGGGVCAYVFVVKKKKANG